MSVQSHIVCLNNNPFIAPNSSLNCFTELSKSQCLLEAMTIFSCSSCTHSRFFWRHFEAAALLRSRAIFRYSSEFVLRRVCELDADELVAPIDSDRLLRLVLLLVLLWVSIWWCSFTVPVGNADDWVDWSNRLDSSSSSASNPAGVNCWLPVFSAMKREGVGLGALTGVSVV